MGVFFSDNKDDFNPVFEIDMSKIPFQKSFNYFIGNTISVTIVGYVAETDTPFDFSVIDSAEFRVSSLDPKFADGYLDRISTYTLGKTDAAQDEYDELHFVGKLASVDNAIHQTLNVEIFYTQDSEKHTIIFGKTKNKSEIKDA